MFNTLSGQRSTKAVLGLQRLFVFSRREPCKATPGSTHGLIQQSKLVHLSSNQQERDKRFEVARWSIEPYSLIVQNVDHYSGRQIEEAVAVDIPGCR